eukprot:6176897-Pleurochrysis_carterae.AAC.2
MMLSEVELQIVQMMGLLYKYTVPRGAASSGDTAVPLLLKNKFLCNHFVIHVSKLLHKDALINSAAAIGLQRPGAALLSALRRSAPDKTFRLHSQLGML